jgi:hypothetical protein
MKSRGFPDQISRLTRIKDLRRMVELMIDPNYSEYRYYKTKSSLQGRFCLLVPTYKHIILATF